VASWGTQWAVSLHADQIARYRARLSGLLVDRIDIKVEARAPRESELTGAAGLWVARTDARARLQRSDKERCDEDAAIG
jgi:predicted ATPase with chaperone activity